MVDRIVTKSILNTVTVLLCRAGAGCGLRNSQILSQNFENRDVTDGTIASVLRL